MISAFSEVVEGLRRIYPNAREAELELGARWQLGLAANPQRMEAHEAKIAESTDNLFRALEYEMFGDGDHSGKRGAPNF